MSEHLDISRTDIEPQVQDGWQETARGLQELGVSRDTMERAGQVAAMTGEGLTRFITEVHKIVAPEELHTPSEVAREIVKPDGSVTAVLLQPAERQPFMDKAAGLIRRLADERAAPEDDVPFLKRAANVVALAVVLTHHFEDGNGRTARTAAQLIKEGLDSGSEESMSDMKILSANRTGAGFRVNSYVPTGVGREAAPGKLLEIAAALDIPLQDQIAYNTQRQEAFTAPTSD